MSERFVILDGSSLFYRAFYALPMFTDSQGEPTGAIFGFSNMLTKLLGDLQPQKLVIAFDKSRKTFRTERYAAYKGTRDKTPEELLAQIPLLKDFAQAFGITFLEKDNYEADDIIGTLATKAAAQGEDVIVVTGDRDALQLVRPNLHVLMTKKGISEYKNYDEAAFKDEYGFEPIKLIDLKGLMGDSSDNIPGVPGVGPKTATKLLLAYGSLEGVYENLDKVAGKKLKERLSENKEQAVLSKELATIELNVPNLPLELGKYDITPDNEAMKAFCERYELRKVWQNFARLYASEGTEAEEAAPAIKVDLSYETWSAEQAKQELSQAAAIAVSAEFSGQAPFWQLEKIAVCTLVPEEKDSGESLDLFAENTLLIPNQVAVISKDEPAFNAALDAMEVTSKVIVQQLKPFYQAGIQPGKQFFSVEIADYLLRPEYSKYDLATMAKQYFPDEEVPAEFAQPEEKLVWEARLLARLQPVLTAELEKFGMTKLYETIELPLVEVLAAMEQNGVFVNREHLQQKNAEVTAKIAEIQQDIYILAGQEFNINSPKQLGEILFEKLNLPVIKKTKTGYSTNAEVLEQLRFMHPVIEQILAYRMWMKLKSTYLDGIEGLINAESGRVHTSFNQTVTATGRLSSSDPNLQNIPVRREEGRTIRALFEPGPGYDALLSADYSQIELRILAHMSGDPNFIDAFVQNQDIHARTAAEVFGVPLSEVTPDLRRKAKAVNFGIVYGISDFGLAKDLHISKKEAGHYIETYFGRYPGVKKFLDDTVAKAHETGGVTTLFGRRRELPAIKSRNFAQRSLAERMAMNTPIQGTAADVIKLAMTKAYHELKAAHVKSRILLQVHDELVLEVVNDEIEQVTAILKDAMENIVKLSVPLVIDVHSGKNWAEAK